MNSLFKIRQFNGKKWLYLKTLSIWDSKGKLFSSNKTVELLESIKLTDTELYKKLEVQEYSLIQTKTLSPDKVIQYKKTKFLPSDLNK